MAIHKESVLIRGVLISLIICLFCISSLPASNNNIERKEAFAVRINPSPPQIDGELSDKAWQHAPEFGGFLQHDPKEGEEATENTTFKVIYDDEAIYFGIECYDSQPDKIVSRLGRRDVKPEADWVSISIDPYFDHQTGYWFTAQASGAITDGTITNDGWGDSSWDGVWEVKTKIHDQGWIAEFKIPYHVLRFNPKDEYIWGLNIERSIIRKKEFVQWVLISRDKPGRVSRFGVLKGIKDIKPPNHLEIIPYTMGRTIMADKNDLSGNIGVDVRYGITSNVSLNATINPDFGQVEADPSELNLTAFESYFREKRPFFVEGAGIFKNQDYDIFYSRRIGRYPGHFPIPENVAEISRSEATTIYSAFKLTGKTKHKTTFGILDAVTSPEYAKVDENGKVKDDFLVEPLTNYLVGRINQDIMNGSSRIGLLTTAVHRKDSVSAYAGSMDWSLNFLDKTYEFSGTTAISNAGIIDDDNQKGYLVHLEGDKRGKTFGGELGFFAISPDFNINDLGFIRRTDIIRSWGRISYTRNKPLFIFRKGDCSLSIDSAWNYNNDLISKGFDIWSWMELKNYWWVNIESGRNFATMNDDELRRDGPLMRSLPNYYAGFTIHTDSRKSVAFRISPFMSRKDDGSSYSRHISFEFETRPISNLQIYIEPSFGHRFSFAQWVERIEKQVDNKTEVHYVFGELDSRTLDITARANVCFTPKLTLEVFLQPFVAVGNYDNFKELAKYGTYDFKNYNYEGNPDFHSRALKSNAVLRWEFRPGSTLYVVWSQSRGLYIDNPTLDDLKLKPIDRLSDVFSDEGSNVFLVKVNYWIGI
jgi:hypothetical protein